MSKVPVGGATFGTLRALDVMYAAGRAICSIEDERAERVRKLAESRRHRLFRQRPLSYKEARARLTPTEVEDEEFYRHRDCERLKDVFFLARAVGDLGPDMNIEVSAEDFKLIREEWRG